MTRVISPDRVALAALRTPLTPGERRVLEAFDRLLSPEWEIYVQPHLNGLRPDFVLLHPRVGIGVFEVKDWDLDAIAYATEQRREGPPLLVGRDRSGKRFVRRDNPVDKVHEYKRAILELYCPRLALKANRQPRFVATVTAGVIMAGTTTARARQLLGPSWRHHSMGGAQERYHPVVGGDDLDRGNLAAIFPWAHECRSRVSALMSPDLADDLRSWLVEPDFAAAQRQPLTLDNRQQALVTSRTTSGYRRIKGPAGSGKSMVLAARAAHLSAEGRDVLVVTFNRTLWHYLRDLAVRYPIATRQLNDRVTWCHFHEWCKTVCVAADLEDEYRALWADAYAGGSDAIDDGHLGAVLEHALPALVGRALATARGDIPRYDALLVDEGQDFNLAWWNLLRLVVRPGGEYLLVADATQDLYDRTRYWTEASMAGAGFPGGNWVGLSTSYRLPAPLVPLLRRFAEQYLPPGTVNLPESVQLGLSFGAVRLRWIQVERDRAVDVCVEAVAGLPATSSRTTLAFPDITLLVTSHEFGLRCVERLADKGVHCAHVFGVTWQDQRDRKLAFYMGDARVKASTIHSFKGWETRALVLYLDTADDLQSLAVAYVGLSRLKQHDGEAFMTVVCSAPLLEAYGRSWPGGHAPSIPES